MSLPFFKPGDRVWVPAGTEIWNVRTGSYGSSARGQAVLVDHIQTEWFDAPQGHRYQKQTIVWSGAGSYWRRAKVTKDMQLMERRR